MTEPTDIQPAANGTVSQQDDTPWTEEQIELIKETCAKNATDEELKLFLYQAQKKGLDPLSRQIHFVKRGGSPTIQTGIDGYRLIADRTGQYAGNDDYRYDEGLTQYEHLQTGANRPTTATATVYKIVQGKRVPFSATAGWNEYAPDQGAFMWKKMPYLMLGKCAEALALRRAFPAELSGVYTKAEMDQAEGDWEDVDRSPERTAEPSGPDDELIEEVRGLSRLPVWTADEAEKIMEKVRRLDQEGAEQFLETVRNETEARQQEDYAEEE